VFSNRDPLALMLQALPGLHSEDYLLKKCSAGLLPNEITITGRFDIIDML
jgi:hypothetical protein